MATQTVLRRSITELRQRMLATKEEKCTVTMSALKAPIDYKSLEEELHATLAADELYKLQNDAKIRAVEQGVPTYEHFRQLVEGAHLKPLERSDKTPKIGVQWNPMVGIKSRDSTSRTTSEKLVGNKCNSELAAKKSSETCKEFLQFWENIADNGEKFIYIWNLRNILQSHIFRVEIPASFLSDFIDTCLRHSSNVDDVTPITELLTILSTCNRFDLTMCFMTKDEHSRCEQLFQHLQGRSQDDSSKSVLEFLAAKYRIK